MQSSHPNNPPIYRNATSTYPNVHIILHRSTLPNSISLPGVAPNCADVQSIYRAPPPAYQVQDPPYQNPHLNYQAPMLNYKTNSYPTNQAPRQNNRGYQQMPPLQGIYDPPRTRFEKNPSRNFTALAESRTKLYERLAAAAYIHPVGPKPEDINLKFYRTNQRCAYHSNSVWHGTEDCINLKHKIQDFIYKEVVSLHPASPNVNTNPFPNHGGGNISVIETDDDCVERK